MPPHIIMDEDDIARISRKYSNLTTALEDYIQLLEDELKEIVFYAAAHNWTSSRYTKGIALRNKISEYKKSLDTK